MNEMHLISSTKQNKKEKKRKKKKKNKKIKTIGKETREQKEGIYNLLISIVVYRRWGFLRGRGWGSSTVGGWLILGWRGGGGGGGDTGGGGGGGDCSGAAGGHRRRSFGRCSLFVICSSPAQL